MNSETTQQTPRPSSKKTAVISLAAFILLMLAIAVQLTYSLMVHENIYKNVYVGDVYVGGLSSDGAKSLLKDKYATRVFEGELVLKSKSSSEKLRFSDIGLTFDLDAAVSSAYEYARTGNIFQRFYALYQSAKNPLILDLPFSYNRSKTEVALQSIYKDTFVAVKKAELLFQEDKVLLRAGHFGESFDKTAATNEIEAALKSGKSGTLELPIIKTPPGKIDQEDFYKQIVREAEDASIKIENNTVTLVPHITGRIMDKAAFSAIAKETEKTEDTEKILPVEFIKPKITREELNAKLFKDTLGTMYTQFYTGNINDANRGENIRLSVPKFNGKILAPGEIFSFNGVVGPRNEAGGYKTAHAYVAGGIVDSVGGGICQVSTTLYNSVLLSNLDILERTNHMFTVGYVPLGRDAAVSYDEVDLKFRNSTSYPIKIEGIVTNSNRIAINIKGTNENPGSTVEIIPKTIQTLAFGVKYTDDPLLEEGVQEVTSEGITGYIVETYKVVKKDGKVISEDKLHRSKYTPLDREVRRGTKKP